MRALGLLAALVFSMSVLQPPAFGGAIGSGSEILGKAVCDGPRC